MSKRHTPSNDSSEGKEHAMLEVQTSLSTQSNRRTAASLCCLALIALGSWAGAATPPGQKFNLSNWNLQTPLSSGGGILTIKQPALATYTSSVFYTASDGAMTFWCPVTGATTGGTSYPRSELRNLREFSVTGTNTLTARCRVLQQPSNGSIIIGQVHGHVSGSELCKLRWSGGKVQMGVKSSLGASETRRTIGSYSLGATLNYTLKVSNRVLTVTVNGTSLTQTLNSSWNVDTYYFKAGSYVQDNSGSSSEGGRVAFYSLSRNQGTPRPSGATPPLSRPRRERGGRLARQDAPQIP